MVALEDARHAIEAAMEGAAFVLEVVAVAIIVYGTAHGLVDFVRGLARKRAHETGRIIILDDIVFGLDVLVAADIILTSVTRSLESLVPLAAIVAIRIILTFALERELKALRERNQRDRKEREAQA